MRPEQFIAIILVLTLLTAVCSVTLYSCISDRLDDIENMINNIKKALAVSKETSTSEKPYVGDAILTDAHGNTWHGQLRRTYKDKAGYSFEPYSDDKSCCTCRYRYGDCSLSMCTDCYCHSNWERRAQ